MTTHLSSKAFFTTLLALAAGCATAAPKELVDARSTYARAKASAAPEVAPVQLLEARQSLDVAERAFRDEGVEPTTRDLAYVAQRRAQIALVAASVAMNRNRMEQAGVAHEGTEDLIARRTRSELTQTRRDLQSKSRDLAVRSEQVQSGQRALAGEQARRQQAEREAAAAMESLRQVATVQEEARGIVITLSGAVLFASGESTLLPIAQQKLDQVAVTLQDHEEQTILVEGHTDSRGGARMNEELSLRRAQAVREYLVSRGVVGAMIRAVGLGSSRPVVDNRTAEGRANNRRVEIVVEPSRVGAQASR